MPITYGLTSEGLTIKTLPVILESLREKWRARWGVDADVSDGAPDGILIGTFAEPLAELWGVVGDVHTARDPDYASGAAQDAVCSLTGTLRPDASYSTVVLTLIGTNATSITAGKKATDEATGTVYETTETVTIATVSAWSSGTNYAAGDRRTAGGNIYQCTLGGSGGSVAPSGTDYSAVITGTGSARWRFVGTGAACVDVLARATETGPKSGVAFGITTIVNPTAGWAGVINLEDVTLGSNRGSDEGLRILRESELGKAAGSPVIGIRAEIAGLTTGTNPVTSVFIFENDTDHPNADGKPAHSVEPLVEGGDDQTIWDTLAGVVAGGIRTHGTEIGTYTDSAGNAHTFRFSRPESVAIYHDLTIEVDPALFPADGAALVEAAIVAWGNALGAGQDVRAHRAGSPAYSVPGVLDVTSSLIDITPGPLTSNTIPISRRQRSAWSTSRINVTSTPVVP